MRIFVNLDNFKHKKLGDIPRHLFDSFPKGIRSLHLGKAVAKAFLGASAKVLDTAKRDVLDDEVVYAFGFQGICHGLRDQDGQHDRYCVGEGVCELKHDDSQRDSGALVPCESDVRDI